jgi:hypothetical protein
MIEASLKITREMMHAPVYFTLKVCMLVLVFLKAVSSSVPPRCCLGLAPVALVDHPGY